MIRYEEFQELEDSLKDNLSRYESGSEEHNRIIDSFVKVERMRMDQQKIDCEQELREMQYEAQQKRDKMDMILKHSINGAEYLVGLVFSWKVVKFILKFEEEGVVRSFGGRQGLTKILGNFLRFK